MELNLRQMDGASNGGSEQASSSDDGLAFRKMMQKEVELMVIHTVRQVMPKEVEVMVIRAVRQVIGPIVEDLTCKVMKEEIESAQEKFSGGDHNTNANGMPKERNLHLKFLDEVSLPVLTGKTIEGKGGTKLKVGLFHKMSGEVVSCGPESSGKVEMLLLDDNEHNWSLEDFNNRIIKEGDKTKPRFAKQVYVDLEGGIGILDNAKLGHDSSWMKKCECRLGARMENFTGIKVQEAWTESFTVSDKRVEFHGKNHRPSLSDNVSRLKNIGKGRGQRLRDNNIKTVKDFLILQSINPQRLQQIVSKGAEWEAASAASAKWKATVDHAHTCIIDDKTVLYYESSEINMGVAFNVVGGVKGIIHDSHFIPYDNLSEEEKDSAHKLLLSANENQKDIKSFEEEDALLQQFPLRPCFVVDVPSWSPSYLFFELDNRSETCGDISTLNFPEDNNINNNKHNESCSHQRSNGGAIHFGGAMAVMLWMVRVRKRSMALGGIHAQKKQRID